MPYLKTYARRSDEPFLPGDVPEAAPVVDEVKPDVPVGAGAPSSEEKTEKKTALPSAEDLLPKGGYDSSDMEEALRSLNSTKLVKQAASGGVLEAQKALEVSYQADADLEVSEVLDYLGGRSQNKEVISLLGAPAFDVSKMKSPVAGSTADALEEGGAQLAKVRSYEDIATDLFDSALKQQYVDNAVAKLGEAPDPERAASAAAAAKAKYRADLTRFHEGMLKAGSKASMRDAKRFLADEYGTSLALGKQEKRNVLIEAAREGADKTLNLVDATLAGDVGMGLAGVPYKAFQYMFGDDGAVTPLGRGLPYMVALSPEDDQERAVRLREDVQKIPNFVYQTLVRGEAFVPGTKVDLSEQLAPYFLQGRVRQVAPKEATTINATALQVGELLNVPAAVNAGIMNAESAGKPKSRAFNLHRMLRDPAMSAEDKEKVFEVFEAAGYDPAALKAELKEKTIKSFYSGEGAKVSDLMAQVNPVAAARATAWGLFQVMGKDGKLLELISEQAKKEGTEVDEDQAARIAYRIFQDEDSAQQWSRLLYANWWRERTDALMLANNLRTQADVEKLSGKYHGIHPSGESARQSWIKRFNEGYQSYTGEEPVVGESPVELPLDEDQGPSLAAQREQTVREEEALGGRVENLLGGIADFFLPGSAQRTYAQEREAEKLGLNLVQVRSDAWESGREALPLPQSAKGQEALQYLQRFQRKYGLNVVDYAERGLGKGFRDLRQETVEKAIGSAQREAERKGLQGEELQTYLQDAKQRALTEAAYAATSAQVAELWVNPIITSVRGLTGVEGETWFDWAPNFIREYAEAVAPKIEVIGRFGNEIIYRQEGGGMTGLSLLDALPGIGQSFNVGVVNNFVVPELMGMGMTREQAQAVSPEVTTAMLAAGPLVTLALGVSGKLDDAYYAGVAGVADRDELVQTGMSTMQARAGVAAEFLTPLFELMDDQGWLGADLTGSQERVTALKDSIRAGGAIAGMGVGLFGAVLHPDLMGGGASAARGLARARKAALLLTDDARALDAVTHKRFDIFAQGVDRLEAAQAPHWRSELLPEKLAQMSPEDARELEESTRQAVVGALAEADELDAALRKGHGDAVKLVDTWQGERLVEASAAGVEGAKAALNPTESRQVADLVRAAVADALQSDDPVRVARAQELHQIIERGPMRGRLDQIILSPTLTDTTAQTSQTAFSAYDTATRMDILLRTLEIVDDVSLTELPRMQLLARRLSQREVSTFAGRATNTLDGVELTDDAAKVVMVSPDGKNDLLSLYGVVDAATLERSFETLRLQPGQTLDEVKDEMRGQRAALESLLSDLRDSVVSGEIIEDGVADLYRNRALDLSLADTNYRVLRNSGASTRGGSLQKVVLAIIDEAKAAQDQSSVTETLHRGVAALTATSLARGEAVKDLARTRVDLDTIEEIDTFLDTRGHNERLQRVFSSIVAGTQEGLQTLVQGTPFLGRMLGAEVGTYQARMARQHLMRADGSTPSSFAFALQREVGDRLQARLSALASGAGKGDDAAEALAAIQGSETYRQLEGELQRVLSPEWRTSVVSWLHRAVEQRRRGEDIDIFDDLPVAVDIGVFEKFGRKAKPSRATTSFLNQSKFFEAFGFAGTEERRTRKLSQKTSTRRKRMGAKDRKVVATLIDQMVRGVTGVTPDMSPAEVNKRVGGFFDNVVNVQRVTTGKRYRDAADAARSEIRTVFRSRLTELLSDSLEPLSADTLVGSWVTLLDDAEQVVGDLYVLDEVSEAGVKVRRLEQAEDTTIDIADQDSFVLAPERVRVIPEASHASYRETMYQAWFDAVEMTLDVMDPVVAYRIFEMTKDQLRAEISAQRGAVEAGTAEPKTASLFMQGEDAALQDPTGEYLYHSTLLGNVAGVAEDGLLPGSGRNFGGYAGHARGRVFLGEPGAARGWFNKVSDIGEYGHSEDVRQHVGVMLRTKKLPAYLDDAGTRDVMGGRSWYTDKGVPANELEFWDSEAEAWRPVSEWDEEEAVGRLTRRSPEEVMEDMDLTEDEIWELDEYDSSWFDIGRRTPPPQRVLYQEAGTAGAEGAEVEEARRLWAEQGTESPYFKRWFGNSKTVVRTPEAALVEAERLEKQRKRSEHHLRRSFKGLQTATSTTVPLPSFGAASDQYAESLRLIEDAAQGLPEEARPHVVSLIDQVRDQIVLLRDDVYTRDVDPVTGFPLGDLTEAAAALVDETPLVLYHGSPSGKTIEAFAPDRFSDDALFGPGVYTTTSEDVARGYAGLERALPTSRVGGRATEASDVLPLFVRVENPLDVRSLDREAVEEVQRRAIPFIERAGGRVPTTTGRSFGVDPGSSAYLFILDAFSNVPNSGKAAQQVLLEMGYDGIIHTGGSLTGEDKLHTVVIAFDPTQVKSVNNRGTFSSNDARVLYQKTDAPPVDDAPKASALSPDVFIQQETKRDRLLSYDEERVMGLAYSAGIDVTGMSKMDMITALLRQENELDVPLRPVQKVSRARAVVGEAVEQKIDPASFNKRKKTSVKEGTTTGTLVVRSPLLKTSAVEQKVPRTYEVLRRRGKVNQKARKRAERDEALRGLVDPLSEVSGMGDEVAAVDTKGWKVGAYEEYFDKLVERLDEKLAHEQQMLETAVSETAKDLVVRRMTGVKDAKKAVGAARMKLYLRGKATATFETRTPKGTYTSRSWEAVEKKAITEAQRPQETTDLGKLSPEVFLENLREPYREIVLRLVRNVEETGEEALNITAARAAAGDLEVTDEHLQELLLAMRDTGMARRSPVEGVTATIPPESVGRLAEMMRGAYGFYTIEEEILDRINVFGNISRHDLDALTRPDLKIDEEVDAFLRALEKNAPEDYAELVKYLNHYLDLQLEEIDNEIKLLSRKVKANTKRLPEISNRNARERRGLVIRKDEERIAQLQELRAQYEYTPDAAPPGAGKPPRPPRNGGLGRADEPTDVVAKGMTRFIDDARAIITAFASADISTGLHELAHVARRQLNDAQQARVLVWVNSELAKKGRPTVTGQRGAGGAMLFYSTSIESVIEAEELFTRGFERYLREGSAPTAALRHVFQKMKDILKRIYAAVSGSDIDVPVSADMYNLFDELFGAQRSLRLDQMPGVTDYLDAQQEMRRAGSEVRGAQAARADRIVEQRMPERTAIDRRRQRLASLEDYRTRGVGGADLDTHVEAAQKAGRTVGAGREGRGRIKLDGKEKALGPLSRRYMTTEEVAAATRGDEKALAKFRWYAMADNAVVRAAYWSLQATRATLFGGDNVRHLRAANPAIRSVMNGPARDLEENISELSLKLRDISATSGPARRLGLSRLFNFFLGPDGDQRQGRGLMTGARRGQRARQGFVNSSQEMERLVHHFIEMVSDEGQEALEQDVRFAMTALVDDADLGAVGARENTSLDRFWRGYSVTPDDQPVSVELVDGLVLNATTTAELAKTEGGRVGKEALSELHTNMLASVYKALTGQSSVVPGRVPQSARHLAALMAFASGTGDVTKNGVRLTIDDLVPSALSEHTDKASRFFEFLYNGGVLRREGVEVTVKGLATGAAGIEPEARQLGTMLMMHVNGYTAGVLQDYQKNGRGIIDSRDMRALTAYQAGRADLLSLAEINRAKELSDRFGFVRFEASPLGNGVAYIPASMRLGLEEQVQQAERQLGQTTADRSWAKTYIQRGAGWILSGIIFGNIIGRQAFKIMSTQDLAYQLGLVVGGEAGVAAGARASALTLLTAIGGERAAEVAEAITPDAVVRRFGKTLPKGSDALVDSFKMSLRRASVTRMDELVHHAADFFGQAKFRVEVAPIMDNTDDMFVLNGSVYTASGLRREFTRAGLYSNAYKEVRHLFSKDFAGSTPEERSVTRSQLDEMLRDNGASDANLAHFNSVLTSVSSSEEAVRALRRTSSTLFEYGLESADAWSDLERTGGAVTLIEMGIKPYDAAKLVVEAVYDYRGSMTKSDRSWARKLAMPFWAFRKNANIQFVNLASDPATSFRMMALNRATRWAPRALTYALYEYFLEPYDVNVDGMSATQRDLYYGLRTQLEYGYGDGPSEEVLAEYREALPEDQQGISDDELLDYSFDGWTIREGFQGYPNVPSEMKLAVRALIAGRGSVTTRQDGGLKGLKETLTSQEERERYVQLGRDVFVQQGAGDYGLSAWAARRPHIQIPIPQLEEFAVELHRSRRLNEDGKENVAGLSFFTVLPDNFIQAATEMIAATLLFIPVAGNALLSDGTKEQVFNVIKPVVDVRGYGSPLGQIGAKWLESSLTDKTAKVRLHPLMARMLEGTISLPITEHGSKVGSAAASSLMVLAHAAAVGSALPGEVFAGESTLDRRTYSRLRNFKVGVNEETGLREVTPVPSFGGNEYVNKRDDRYAYQPYLYGTSALAFAHSPAGAINKWMLENWNDSTPENAMETSESFQNFLVNVALEMARGSGLKVTEENPETTAIIERPR